MNDACEGDLPSPEQLAELRRDAERYRWLRQRAGRLQGSEIWWQGGALDLRVDTGLDHVQGECTAEAQPRRVTRNTPKLTHAKEPRR